MSPLPTTRKERRAWHERAVRDNTPRWEAMTGAERSLFIAESIEARHRRQYEAALALAGHTGPDWDDLSDTQRQRVREENRDHDRRMQGMGEALTALVALEALDGDVT